MANEIQWRGALRITNGNLQYASPITSFNDDMTGKKGPTPGALTIPVGGKVIPLNELTEAGWCEMTNLDTTNYVEYGVRDPDTDRFYPFGELHPGKPQVVFLSRNLLEAYEGTGTGTSGPNNQFFMKANGAPCNVTVFAFQR